MVQGGDGMMDRGATVTTVPLSFDFASTSFESDVEFFVLLIDTVN